MTVLVIVCMHSMRLTGKSQSFLGGDGMQSDSPRGPPSLQGGEIQFHELKRTIGHFRALSRAIYEQHALCTLNAYPPFSSLPSLCAKQNALQCSVQIAPGSISELNS